jgi:CRISPR-associated endonuclease/helicase Cas3
VGAFGASSPSGFSGFHQTKSVPGTIVVPAGYGGLDEFGWNPDYPQAVLDVADRAALPFSGHKFVIRIAPGLLGGLLSGEALCEALAATASERWRDVRNAMEALSLPHDIKGALRDLDRAKGKAGVKTYDDLYGYDNGRPRGIAFVAQFGLADGNTLEDGRPGSTEDDWAGSLPGFELTLEQHSADVETKAEEFARRSEKYIAMGTPRKPSAKKLQPEPKRMFFRGCLEALTGA